MYSAVWARECVVFIRHFGEYYGIKDRPDEEEADEKQKMRKIEDSGIVRIDYRSWMQFRLTGLAMNWN